MSATLLVEIFTEELPPKALKILAAAFTDRLLNGLTRLQLMMRDAAGIHTFATPRRLAVSIPKVFEKAQDRVDSKKLMPAKVAFGAGGEPTAALIKRLEKEGFPVGSSGSQIKEQLRDREGFVFLDQTIAGPTLAEGLQIALEEAVSKLPIPKVMSYQLADGATTVKFVRPARGLVALHGTTVVPVSILGLEAGRITHGHRFQGVNDITIPAADAYAVSLAAHGNVIASFEERLADIRQQLEKNAGQLEASLGPLAEYEALLEEVTALVERPAVYTGEFESGFLTVPPECLVLTMRQNQKYFPLFDSARNLINKFLIVSNMRLTDPKNIIEGNERVIRPRLADARFFYETDKQTRLEARVPMLEKIIYHHKLGSQLDRVERVRKLAKGIAEKTRADGGLAARAALLAKADLVTNMVGEFPELQGTMGRYYALADGEDALVADAIQQHYRPRFAGDALPDNTTAIALALADKMETLAGMFGIGQQPTGDKDPFALRRHALGVIRILIEADLALSLHDLVNMAFEAFPRGLLGEAHTEVQGFIYERLRSYLRDGGYTANEIESLLCMLPVRLNLVPSQLAAVREFALLPEAASLAAANKRVANILKQAEAKGELIGRPERGKLQEKAERELYETIQAAVSQAAPLFERNDYTGYLKIFAILKIPVDAFFDSVMVMVDDGELRRNRLALLSDLRLAMNRVADLSKLAA
jgi:glycyl-tRNA synthetase beta chain